MKIGKGAIIGLVGGLLGLVGVFLPWLTVSASVGPISVSASVSGISMGGGTLDLGTGTAIPVGASEFSIYVYGILAFSVLGLIVVMLGKRSTAMLALVFGLLTTILAIVAVVRMSQLASALQALIPVVPGMTVSIGAGIGLYLCVIGGIILLLGGVLAMGDAKKAMMAPAPMPMAPPMPPPQ